jgi:molybdate transport system permease protein
LNVSGVVLGGLLVLILTAPLLALLWRVELSSLSAGLMDERFHEALSLSLKTSSLSLLLTLILGTPLAWWLSRTHGGAHGRAQALVSLLVELPIALPPSVVGVALLVAFGHHGLFGGLLKELSLSLPFTQGAVVLAQLVVSAPFYLKSAVSGLKAVDDELLLVARTLGASPWESVRRVALPIALPSLIAGASLAWARALGELGATLMFAGNMMGETQTMPLAILSALEGDLSLALALSLTLAVIASLLLLIVRSASALAPSSWGGVR